MDLTGSTAAADHSTAYPNPLYTATTYTAAPAPSRDARVRRSTTQSFEGPGLIQFSGVGTCRGLGLVGTGFCELRVCRWTNPMQCTPPPPKGFA